MVDERDVREWVQDLLQKNSPEGLRPDARSDLFAGGYLDSMGMIVLISEISLRFGIFLSPDALREESLRNVDAIVELVMAGAPG